MFKELLWSLFDFTFLLNLDIIYKDTTVDLGGLMMEKIKMTTPLVEMDGDEMTRILWKMIKDELLLPYVDLKTENYD